MNQQALLTIIIPCHNAMQFLPGCIDSIQKYAGELLGKSLQVHIQNGESDDNIIEYVNGLKQDGVSICSQQDHGIYNAMNLAVNKVESSWVYFLGADDRLAPEFSHALPHLHEQSSIYYANVIKTSNGLSYDGKFSTLKLVYRNICQQAIFYPRELLAKHPFSEKYPIQSDWASNIKLMAQLSYKYIDCRVAYFNDQTGISSTKIDTVFYADKSRLVYESLGLLKYLASVTAPVPTQIYHLLSGKKRTRAMLD